MIKPALSALAIVASTFIPLAALAQEQQGCFMIDPSGRPVDLGALCGDSSSAPKRFTAIIKRREAGIPVIDVTFNGKQTFEMMVDTGASGVVITPDVAAALDVKEEGVVQAFTPSDKEATFKTGRVASVEAGGLVSRDIVVAISPALTIGLLGQDFFGSYDVVIKKDVVEFLPR